MPRIDRIVMGILGVALLGATLCLSACDALKPDPQRLAESRAVYDQFVRDDVAGLQARMSPEAKAAATPDKIEELRRFIPGRQAAARSNTGPSSFVARPATSRSRSPTSTTPRPTSCSRRVSTDPRARPRIS